MAKTNVIPIHRPQPSPTNPLTVYLQTLAPTGRRTLQSLLNTALSLIEPNTDIHQFDWSTLRYEDLVSIRFQLLNHNKSLHTVNTTLAALRGVIRTAFHMGQLDGDTYLRVTAIPSVRGETLPAGRALSSKEVQQLQQAALNDKTLIGLRNQAILAVLIHTGLRRNELVNLLVGDYQPHTRELVIRQGKGRRQRILELPKTADTSLSRWLRHRPDGQTPLFCRIRKNDQLTNQALSAQAIYSLVTTLAEDAGLEKCTPHDLRRTFITQQLQNGVDPFSVSRLAGHCDLKSTQHYDRRVSD